MGSGKTKFIAKQSTLQYQTFHLQGSTLPGIFSDVLK
jgi:hypothetical protein